MCLFGPLALNLFACKECQRRQPQSLREPWHQEACSFGPQLENASQTGPQVPLPWITQKALPWESFILCSKDKTLHTEVTGHFTRLPTPPPTRQTTVGPSSSMATQSSLLHPTLLVVPGPREGIPIPIAESPDRDEELAGEGALSAGSGRRMGAQHTGRLLFTALHAKRN